MDIKDLLGKEVSNLYAIAKQANHYLDGSDIDFLSEKQQLVLVDYLKFVCHSEEQTREVLDNLDININPGNTVDSIVKEITENLSSIAKQHMDITVKSKGYLSSVNRLMGYHLANMENLTFFVDQQEEVKSILVHASTLSTIKEQLIN